MELSWQGYWSELPFPRPGDLPKLEIEPSSPVFPALVGGFFTTEPLGKPVYIYIMNTTDGQMVKIILFTIMF